MKPIPKPTFISRQVRQGRYLFVDLTPASDVDFTVVCAGREECTPDYRVQRNGFRYHAIEFVVSGKWELAAGGRTQSLGPGALFSYGPGTRYALGPLDEDRLVKFFVDFAGRRAAALLRASGLREGVPGRVAHTRWLHDIFDQLLDCANLSRPAARRIGTHLTLLLLMRLKEDLRSAFEPGPGSHRTYLRCRQFIGEHCTAIRGVEEIARRCNLNAAYLSRLFQRFAQESPSRYLARLKMDHAAELILRRNYGVKQAAAAVGYDDPYHFSRVFKRVHGTAPGHFAKERRGDDR